MEAKHGWRDSKGTIMRQVSARDREQDDEKGDETETGMEFVTTGRHLWACPRKAETRNETTCRAASKAQEIGEGYTMGK